MTLQKNSKGRGRKPRSKGLGDTVEKITEATGVKKVVKWLAGEDCGCDKRKEKLNKLFPYKQPKCLTEGEYTFLHEFLGRNPVQVTAQEQKRLIEINNRIFSERREMSSCGSCVKGMIDNLRGVYKEYEAAS